MQKLQIVAVATFMLVVAGGGIGRAADTAQNFAIHGAGAETCQQMIAAVSKDKLAGPLVMSWVFGYLTALNTTTPDVYDLSPIVDPQSIFNLVYNECSRRPEISVQASTATVIAALGRAGVRSPSPITEVHASGHSVEIRTETLVAMQVALSALGRYNGKADGMFGPALEAALRSYQHTEKLPETGLPDAPTIVQLLVDRKEPAPSKN